jgi:hypothetical protein
VKCNTELDPEHDLNLSCAQISEKFVAHFPKNNNIKREYFFLTSSWHLKLSLKNFLETCIGSHF